MAKEKDTAQMVVADEQEASALKETSSGQDSPEQTAEQHTPADSQTNRGTNVQDDSPDAPTE